MKHDPWGASACHSQADKLEELQEAAGPSGGLALDDSGGAGASSMLSQVDDKSCAVVVINSVGIMQMANKVGGCSS